MYRLINLHYYGLIKVRVGPLATGSLLVDNHVDCYGLEILVHKGGTSLLHSYFSIVPLKRKYT